MIADIDIESERFRYCGAMRFDIEGLTKTCNLRTYRGQLYYIEHDGAAEQHIEGPFTVFLASNVTHITTNSNLTPTASFSNQKIDLFIVKEISRIELMKLFLSMDE